jgi:hypothetical protein
MLMRSMELHQERREALDPTDMVIRSKNLHQERREAVTPTDMERMMATEDMDFGKISRAAQAGPFPHLFILQASLDRCFVIYYAYLSVNTVHYN